MNYIDDLIAHGTNFQVERKDGSAAFRPLSGSEADIEAFQSVVHDLRENGGAGYSIFREHPMSDRGGDYVDLVLVVFEEA